MGTSKSPRSYWQTEGIQGLRQHIYGQDFEPNSEPPFEMGVRGDFQMPLRLFSILS